MPELPEVEAARAAIADHCIGKKIVRAIIADDAKVVDGVSPSDFESSLLNKTIVAAHRKGKNMWIQLDSPPFPSFQFGMTGAVYIKGVAVTKYKRSAVNDADEWPSKFSKFFIEVNDGLEISFTDKRRFAKVRLLRDPAAVPPISELGPDALLEPLTEGEFFNSLTKKKIAIKTLLLDQSFISGIGNWIADEVLYQARIHPLQTASSISKEDSSRLLKCIKEVVQHAVEVDADCCLFPFDWLFHFRWGKKAGEVNGKKIDFISVGGRTSAYVPELQKLNGEQATRAPAKPRKQASKKNKDIGDHGWESGDSDDAEEEMSNVKSKQVKNSKARVQKPPKNKKSIKSSDSGDEEEEKATRTSSRTANAKRKLQEKSQAGEKTGKSESNPQKNHDSDASNSDANDNEDGNQKRPRKSNAKKSQKQIKRKAE